MSKILYAHIWANFGIWPPNFIKDLNQKSACHNKGFFYSKAILKVS